MIGKLTGIVEFIAEDHCIIDVGGVGYLVFCSSRLLSSFTLKGEPVSVWVETYVREDTMRLYGFGCLEEKGWFNMLQNVQGIGAKLALAMLSAFSIRDLVSYIAFKDLTSLCRAPGVGKKVAERIVTELNKFALTHSAGTTAGPILSESDDVIRSGAVSALQNLGYGMETAQTMVNSILAKLDKDSTVGQKSAEEQLKHVIRLALKKSPLG